MVLIINSSKRKAQDVSDIFYYMGVISYAATPTGALSEISELYRAVIVMDPEDMPDVESYLKKLRAYSATVPIFALTDNQPAHAYFRRFDAIFPSSIYSSTLVEEIVRYQNQRGLLLTAHYRLAGIDASCDSDVVRVFDNSMRFTKTETMILRYLISAYPAPQSARNIIKYAFKPSRRPEITSIRTHISVMNKKFRDMRGKNLFINLPMQGYIVSTPEVIRSLASIN